VFSLLKIEARLKQDNSVTSGLCCKHTTIVHYASSIINKHEALLTDDALFRPTSKNIVMNSVKFFCAA